MNEGPRHRGDINWQQHTSTVPSGRSFYEHYEEEEGRRTPTAAASLDVFARMPELQQCLEEVVDSQRPGVPFRAMVFGCSYSGNVRALHEFFGEYGIQRVEIYVCDLTNASYLMALKRGRHINSTFWIADAANLPFPSGSIDIGVDDFLVNCAAFNKHRGIASEQARLIRPGGLLLKCYTTWESVEGTNLRRMERSSVEGEFGISLEDVISVDEELAESLGVPCVIVDRDEGVYILVTETGDLEFFRGREFWDKLHAPYFSLRARDYELGIDRNNILCHRHRQILQRNERGVERNKTGLYQVTTVEVDERGEVITLKPVGMIYQKTW